MVRQQGRQVRAPPGCSHSVRPDPQAPSASPWREGSVMIPRSLELGTSRRQTYRTPDGWFTPEASSLGEARLAEKGLQKMGRKHFVRRASRARRACRRLRRAVRTRPRHVDGFRRASYETRGQSGLAPLAILRQKSWFSRAGPLQPRCVGLYKTPQQSRGETKKLTAGSYSWTEDRTVWGGCV